MTKQVYQIFFTVCVSLLLIACQGQEANDAVEEDNNNLPFPTHRPDSQIVEINETYFSGSATEESQALSIYTYSVPETESQSINSHEVFALDQSMIVELDTSSENGAKPDVSIMVTDGSVYKLDHHADELVLVRHFVNEICEVFPKKIVDTDVSGEDGNLVETLSVKHAESVYVVTAFNQESGDACSDPSATRYYYDLQLDFAFNAQNEFASSSSDLTVVEEAEARAKLMFAWVDDAEQDSGYKLSYGYLGYSQAANTLAFFDHQRKLVWSQDRIIDSYSLVDGQASKSHLFDVKLVDDYQYLIQINQDVFVVDASKDIFAKTPLDVDSILTDRVLKLQDRDNQVNSVEFYHDDDDLLIFDQGKIYNYAYKQNAFVPSAVAHSYHIEGKEGLIYKRDELLATKTVSQFDYKACGQGEEVCHSSHDVEDANWQFITACDVDLGCELNEVSVDVCETREENEVSQSDREICTPELYIHLDELDEPGNNAQFLGFMQYFGRFISDYHVSMLSDSLIITASMREKDILVQYFFKSPLNSPKSVRESVLFGGQASLFGLEHFVENEGLYINALVPLYIRSNECYKDYRQVTCNLSSQEQGDSSVCTALDLSLGTCRASFTEFESSALYCSDDQLSGRSCNDTNFLQGGLRKESGSQDGRWLRMLDLSGSEGDKKSMFLLASSHEESVQSQVLDEGRLLHPSLFEVDDSSGEIEGVLGQLSGLVETVLGGVLYEKAETREPVLEGYLDVLSDDSYSSGAGALLSRHSKYAIVQTLSDDNSVAKTLTPKLTESLYRRVDTSSELVSVDEN